MGPKLLAFLFPVVFPNADPRVPYLLLVLLGQGQFSLGQLRQELSRGIPDVLPGVDAGECST